MRNALSKLYQAISNIKPQDITYFTIVHYLEGRLNSKILLYIIDYNGFTEESKLRIIELILAAQSPEVSAKMVNCNSDFAWNEKDGCNGGYTFIHLALYGMSNNDRNNTNTSYSTDFICKLIEIAKKYGFNVNAVTNADDDKDTIAHSAIASEEYTGKVVPILRALGDDFDLYAVNNHNRGNMNLMQAYVFYMNCAKLCRKDGWHKRLLDEADDFKAYLESQKVDLTKPPIRKSTSIRSQSSAGGRPQGSPVISNATDKPKPLINKDTLKTIKNSLSKYQTSDSIDISNFYSFVSRYENEFKIISREKDNNKDFLSIHQTLFGLLSKLESQIKNSPSNDDINKATKIFGLLSYTPKKITPEFISNYGHLLSQINSSLRTADTLAKLGKITDEIKSVCEKDLSKDFKNVFYQRKKDLEQKMAEIEELINKIRTAERALKKSASNISFDRNNTTLNQAQTLIASLNKTFDNLKVEATVALSEAVKAALEPFKELEGIGIIDQGIIDEITKQLPKKPTTRPATRTRKAPGTTAGGGHKA